MKFSIIIPVYNFEKYLRDCLDSVLAQSCQDWEAICVNDGSTDNSLEILKEYADKDVRFKVFSQTNQGQSAARNLAMSKAQGEYVLFLDSDDWWEPNALKVLSENTNGEDIVHFSARLYIQDEGVWHDKNQLVGICYDNGMDYFDDNALKKTGLAFGYVPFRAWKMNFLQKNNLSFKVGIYFEDTLFTAKSCCFAKQVKIIDDCLYNYRIHIQTTMHDPARKAKRRMDLLEVANDLAKFYIQKTGFDKKMVYRYITYQYQIVLMLLEKEDRNANGVVRSKCDWKSYRIVSRTKPRHRLNYWKNRLKYMFLR